MLKKFNVTLLDFKLFLSFLYLLLLFFYFTSFYYDTDDAAEWCNIRCHDIHWNLLYKSDPKSNLTQSWNDDVKWGIRQPHMLPKWPKKATQ